MENKELLDYIKQQLQQGTDKEEIKNSLLTQGWQEQDVEMALKSLELLSEPTKKKKRKKIVSVITWITVSVFVFILLLPTVLGLFTKDITPIDDSDLRLSVISVPDDDNAYFDLIKLENVIYEPDWKSQEIVDMLAGKKWDEKLAEEIISRNTKTFEYFSEASRKSKFQDPAFADPSKVSMDTVLPSLKTWRSAARLSAIRSLYLSKQNKSKEAIEEALISVRIGQKIQESQVTLIEYLVATAMKGIGLETVQNVILSADLKNTELTNYIQELSGFYKNEAGFIAALKDNYRFTTEVITLMTKGITSSDVEEILKITSADLLSKPDNSFYFQPNKTKALFAEYTRQNIKDINNPCGLIVDIQRVTSSSPIKLYITKNAVGKMLYDVEVVSFQNLPVKKCEEDLLVGATQTIFAIKAFQNDTGVKPSSLEELVPNYLSTIPQDPFDGKKIKYSKEKGIIYSVGKDMKDGGGSSSDVWWKMSDPTFKISF